MHAVPPRGPLDRDDRDPAPDWLDEPSREPAVEQTRNQRSAALPTIVLLLSVLVVVLLVVLL
jgi:hypothetical protein